MKTQSNTPSNSFSPKELQQLQDCAREQDKFLVYESGLMMAGLADVVDERHRTYL